MLGLLRAMRLVLSVSVLLSAVNGFMSSMKPLATVGLRLASQPSSATPPTPEPVVVPLAEAKQELQDLLERQIFGREEVDRLPALISSLEKQHAPVATMEFMNLGMMGDWQVALSSLRWGFKQPNLVWEDFTQTMTPSGGLHASKGELTTSLQWRLTERGGNVFTGLFEVLADYEVQQTGAMVCELKGHRLLPAGGKVPTDPVNLVQDLQRVMTPTIFDPSGLSWETAYLDADIRIMKVGGTDKLSGVRNVFIRKPYTEAGLAALEACLETSD